MPEMRFEARWSNGFWKLFDTHRYRGVALFKLQKDAIEAALDANFL